MKCRLYAFVMLFGLVSLAIGEPVEVAIPMRDGKTLAADVYLPPDRSTSDTYPAVLIQTPYSKDRMRAAFRGEGDWGSDTLFTSQDYAFVVTDWRGRFASADAANPPARPGGSEDGFDTVKWITDQHWSNGKVGSWGPSALGGAQYRTAVAQPPGYTCAVPVVMPLNLTYDVYFPGGVMWEEFVRTLSRLGWPLYDLLTSNSVRTSFWDQSSRQSGMAASDIEVPMLLVGGWFDIYIDHVIETFDEITSSGGPAARQHSRLVIGPWIHRTDQVDNGDISYPQAHLQGIRHAERFLDWCLRGEGTLSANRVSWFQMGSNEWRSAPSWPPPGTEQLAFYLGDEGVLSREVPAVSRESSFRFDPADPVPTHGGHVLSPELAAGPRDVSNTIEARGDVVVFTSAALDAPLEVAGRVGVKLFVSSDRPDTDLTVWLTDVYPDGRSIMLTEGILRMRHRNGTDREVMMRSGRVYEVDVDMTHLAQTFLPGHRLRVLVSSSNSPKYHVNPNHEGNPYQDGERHPANNRIHFGGDHPARLMLRVMPQSANAAVENGSTD